MNRHQSFTKQMLETFSRNNYDELHSSLLKLTSEKQQAIQMRFFDNLSIIQIAYVMDITWDETDKLITQALSDLKTMLLDKLNYLRMTQAA